MLGSELPGRDGLLYSKTTATLQRLPTLSSSSSLAVASEASALMLDADRPISATAPADEAVT